MMVLSPMRLLTNHSVCLPYPSKQAVFESPFSFLSGGRCNVIGHLKWLHWSQTTIPLRSLTPGENIVTIFGLIRVTHLLIGVTLLSLRMLGNHLPWVGCSRSAVPVPFRCQKLGRTYLQFKQFCPAWLHADMCRLAATTRKREIQIYRERERI